MSRHMTLCMATGCRKSCVLETTQAKKRPAAWRPEGQEVTPGGDEAENVSGCLVDSWPRST